MYIRFKNHWSNHVNIIKNPSYFKGEKLCYKKTLFFFNHFRTYPPSPNFSSSQSFVLLPSTPLPQILKSWYRVNIEDTGSPIIYYETETLCWKLQIQPAKKGLFWRFFWPKLVDLRLTIVCRRQRWGFAGVSTVRDENEARANREGDQFRDLHSTGWYYTFCRDGRDSPE